MTPSPLFSFVIACYNTAPYLPKALESVKNQSFRDFEAICFVEESTDDSLAICQAVAEHDTRFKVASAPKSGAVATTRNFGIDHAHGKYLVVLDGDDWITHDMLEKLAMKLDATGEVDVLSFAAITTESEEVDWSTAPRFSNFRSSDTNGVFSGLDAIRRVGKNGGKMNNHTVLSIYRTAFLKEHRLYQKDGLLMEDFEWTPRVWFFASRFAYLDIPFYAYRRRPGSLTTEASSRIIYDLVKELKSLMEFVSEHSIPTDILSIWSNQWLAILYWFMYHPVTSKKISDADRHNALEELFKDNGEKAFLCLAKQTSLPKRLALPFIMLTTKGLYWPAKTFFRHFYYPLIEWRHK